MSSKSIIVARVLAITGFAMLVVCTYGLRSEVLKLNRIRFSADQEMAAQRLEQFKEAYPERLAAYELQVRQHELLMVHRQRQMEFYESLIEIAQGDLEEYARLAGDGPPKLPAIPPLPRMPTAPDPPEVRERLAEIDAEFAAQRFHYFDMTSRLNWVACLGALALVGGLLFLVLFDSEGSRLVYLLVLVLSFVFMIGPSFHSILSGIVGFLEAPG